MTVPYEPSPIGEFFSCILFVAATMDQADSMIKKHYFSKINALDCHQKEQCVKILMEKISFLEGNITKKEWILTIQYVISNECGSGFWTLYKDYFCENLPGRPVEMVGDVYDTTYQIMVNEMTENKTYEV